MPSHSRSAPFDGIPTPGPGPDERAGRRRYGGESRTSQQGLRTMTRMRSMALPALLALGGLGLRGSSAAAQYVGGVTAYAPGYYYAPGPVYYAPGYYYAPRPAVGLYYSPTPGPYYAAPGPYYAA